LNPRRDSGVGFLVWGIKPVANTPPHQLGVWETQSPQHSPDEVDFGVFRGLQKSPIFVHNSDNTLFTGHSFAITGRDSFWSGLAQIAAAETEAGAGGVRLRSPQFNH